MTILKNKVYKYLYNIIEYITGLDIVYTGVLGYVWILVIILDTIKVYNLVIGNKEYKVIQKTQKKGMEKGGKMLCTFCIFAFCTICQFFSGDLS